MTQQINQLGQDVKTKVMKQVDATIDRNIKNGHLKTLLSALTFLLFVGVIIKATALL